MNSEDALRWLRRHESRYLYFSWVDEKNQYAHVGLQIQDPLLKSGVLFFTEIDKVALASWEDGKVKLSKTRDEISEIAGKTYVRFLTEALTKAKATMKELVNSPPQRRRDVRR